jgi:hypothetical protein
MLLALAQRRAQVRYLLLHLGCCELLYYPAPCTNYPAPGQTWAISARISSSVRWLRVESLPSGAAACEVGEQNRCPSSRAYRAHLAGIHRWILNQFPIFLGLRLLSEVK